MQESVSTVTLLLDARSIGGIERHVESLYHALPEAGFTPHITLYNTYAHNPWRDSLKAGAIPFTELGGSVSALKSHLRQVRPSLLHTHGYKAGIVGRLVCRSLGLPCVSTFHAGERAQFPVSLYQWLDEKTAIKGATIAVSKDIANRLPKGTPVIANGVSLPHLNPATKPTPKQIGFVGRLSPEKGPDLFCQLATKYQGSGLGFHLYGTGPEEASLRHNFSDAAQFHGLKANMSEVWPSLDLLLMPSRAEGLPMAALEAMAHGVPLVASPVGALPQLIDHGQNGWLAAKGELSALKTALEAALNEENFAEICKNARATIKTRYSAQKMATETAAVYRSALSSF